MEVTDTIPHDRTYFWPHYLPWLTPLPTPGLISRTPGQIPYLTKIAMFLDTQVSLAPTGPTPVSLSVSLSPSVCRPYHFRISILSAFMRPQKASRLHCGGRHGGWYGGRHGGAHGGRHGGGQGGRHGGQHVCHIVTKLWVPNLARRRREPFFALLAKLSIPNLVRELVTGDA